MFPSNQPRNKKFGLPIILNISRSLTEMLLEKQEPKSIKKPISLISELSKAGRVITKGKGKK